MKRLLLGMFAVGLLTFSTGCCSWWWPWGCGYGGGYYGGGGGYYGGCPGGNCGVPPSGGQYAPPQQGTYYRGLDSVESVELNGPQVVPTPPVAYHSVTHEVEYPPVVHEPLFVPQTAMEPLQSLPTY